ncbi:MAG: inosine monophosphate cyclohydrolase [Clostridiales bacterium]|nr:inosine monophosphate cyclohydrolase [Clostridiales bacterium]
MQTYDLCEILRQNTYPGRGLMVGVNDDKALVILYFIMGRSDNSRNRVFAEDNLDVRIEPMDAKLIEDPSLIMYRPVRTISNHYIVSNGDQTDTIYDFLRRGYSFRQALATRSYEPDAPHYTPRISGLAVREKGGFHYTLSILKRQDDITRQYYEYKQVPGVGHLIHTYQYDGSPLPSFEGEPRRVILPHDVDGFVNDAWESLNHLNRIALYARIVPEKEGNERSIVINRYERVKEA